MVLHPSLTRSAARSGDAVAAARHYVSLLAEAADLPVVVIDISKSVYPPFYDMKVMASTGDGHAVEAVTAWARRFDTVVTLSEVSATAVKVSVHPWAHVEVWALTSAPDARAWLRQLHIGAFPAIVTAPELLDAVAAVGDRGLDRGGAR